MGTLRTVFPRTARRSVALVAGAALILGACNNGDSAPDALVPIPGEAASDGREAATDVTPTSAAATTSDATTAPATTPAPATDASTSTTTTTIPPTTSTAATTSTTTSSTTTTTTTVPELDVFAPECVYEVASGDSLGAITDSYDDETITVTNVRAENDIEGETIYPGQLVDICVDNGLDDVTGSERERNAAVVATEEQSSIQAQQTKLNELFAGLGIRELLVDGISGPVTRQRLCAARLGLGLPVTLTDMAPGSDEEKTLMAADGLQLPFTTALNSNRWILIDRTCQIMFAGTGGERLDFVFPTSTGEEGFETRDQDRSRVFRYDPALDNGGWHDSTTYPVEIDNPLNGNMYKPLYFDGGQAIHGANNVPTSPQSKGCARLRPEDQDALVSWLGLADVDGPSWSEDRINVTVNVQGEYPD